MRQVAPEYEGTSVHHALYLPVDWTPGRLHPVIVEYSGNRYPPHCTGRVADCKLGYYQSGGRGFIWVVMPFVNEAEKRNQRTWWGDVPATLRYCRTNLRRICETYGGDPSAIFLTGFSRGAIACGYIGLHTEEMADIWLAFLPHSHHDGGSFTRDGGRERLARIAGRASFLTYGSDDNGKPNSLIGRTMLEEHGFPVTAVEIPDTAHTDEWITRDCAARRATRAWIDDVLARRPGTYEVCGNVTDADGHAIAGVRVETGSMRWCETDAAGRYTLRSVVKGSRRITASKTGYRFVPAARTVVIEDTNVTGIDFVAEKS